MSTKKDQEEKIVIHWSLRKTLTLLVGIFFIPVFVVFLVSLTLQQTVVNPTYYKDSFKHIDAYNRMVNQGIPSLILKTRLSDDAITDTVAKDISTLVLQKVIDPSWIEGATDTLIDSTIDFLTKKNQDITLNLSDARGYLTSASNSLLIITGLIPTCDPTPTKATVSKTSVPVDLSFLCTNKEINFDEIKKNLESIRQEINTVNLEAVKFDEIVSLINTDLMAVRTFAKDIRIYLVISITMLAILIVVIVFLYRERINSIIFSLSLFTGIGSGLALLIGVLGNQVVPKTISQSREIILSPSIRAIINDFLDASISGVFSRLELYAGVTLVVSALLFILAYIRRK